jgi:hypothetical protein
MRGSQVFTYDPQTGGIRADLPPQLVPQGSLIGGSNCLLDIDGLYKPRFGYGAWQSGTPTQALQGLLWYTDIDGTPRYVGGSYQNLYAIVGGSWAKISPALLNGSTSDLVRIVAFDQPYMNPYASTASYMSAIFANNHDPLQIWNAGLASSQALTMTYAAAGTNTYSFNTVPSFSSPTATISALSVAVDGQTVTVTVSSTTNFVVGMGITVLNIVNAVSGSNTNTRFYNGQFVITAIGSGTITWVQALAGTAGAYTSGGSIAATSPYPLNQQFFFTVTNSNTVAYATISALSLGSDNQTVTATLSSASGFFVGQGIVVANATPTDYNGAFTITAVSGSTISWVLSAPLIACPYVSGGTVTGGCTLNLNSIGPVPLRYLNEGVVDELPAGYLIPGTVGATIPPSNPPPYNVYYDGTQFVIGTNDLAPSARDVFILNERVVALNPTDAAGRHPSSVYWSAAFDGQTWPAQAYEDLTDTDDPLIAGRMIGFNAAVVFGEESGWLMQGVWGGSDANAFSFTPIPAVITGPVSPQAIVPYGGILWYLARDLRVWTCDGSTAKPISAPIDALLAADIDTTQLTKAYAFYHAQQKQIWFVYQAVGGGTHAVVIAMRANGPVYEVPQIFSETLTAGALALDNVSSATIAILAAATGSVYQFGASTPNDNTNQIPYSFTPALMTGGALKDILLDSMEVWFKPAPSFELVTLQLQGMLFPFDDAPTSVTLFPVNVEDQATFFLPISLPLLNTYSRYIRLTISGNSYSRVVMFGGAQLFYNPQARASA